MFDYSAVAPGSDLEMSKGMILFYIIYFLIMMTISVVTYVLQSVSLYSISKRRGIKNPWLSWIPVGSMWILGCVSDQYRYVVRGQVKNKRKALLILNILMWVLFVAFFVLTFMFVIQSFGLPETGVVSDSEMMKMMGTVLGMLGMYVVIMGLSIAIIVIQYMALFDLYTSCDPKNNVMYLVLGIFVSVCQPIFLFICRKKDLGMPPRKPEPAAYIPQQPVPQQPQWQPVQEQSQAYEWQPAQTEEPAWQPPEPTKEPWENNPEE